MGSYDKDFNPLFPRGPSLNLKFGLLLALSVALMFIDQRQQSLQPLRNLLSAGVEPVRMIAGIPRGISEISDYFSSRQTLLEENRVLKQQQLLLTARLQKMAAVEAENQRIHALLQSAQSLQEDVLIAKVLATSQDPYRHNLRLNKGSLDGIHVGQPLIDAHGIVGQVAEVSLLSSSALLITDADHGIPVQINRNGLQSIAQGSGEAHRLKLPFMAGNADVRIGDLLVTSGLGGRYPAGYPVAVVTSVEHNPGDHFLRVEAQPTAQLQHGREVLLVSNPASQNTRAVVGGDSPESENTRPAESDPS